MELGHSVLILAPGSAELTDASNGVDDARADLEMNGIELVPVASCLTVHAHSQEKPHLALLQQHMPSDQALLVIASIVAEQSLTIPGLRAVVDTGIARMGVESTIDGVTRHLDTLATKFTTIQRAGRTGRVCAGIVLQLFTHMSPDDESGVGAPVTEMDAAGHLLSCAAASADIASALKVLSTMVPPLPDPSCNRVRNALVAHGLLTQHKGCYELTPSGKLVTGLPLPLNRAHVIALCHGTLAMKLAIACAIYGELGDPIGSKRAPARLPLQNRVHEMRQLGILAEYMDKGALSVPLMGARFVINLFSKSLDHLIEFNCCKTIDPTSLRSRATTIARRIKHKTQADRVMMRAVDELLLEDPPAWHSQDMESSEAILEFTVACALAIGGNIASIGCRRGPESQGSPHAFIKEQNGKRWIGLPMTFQPINGDADPPDKELAIQAIHQHLQRGGFTQNELFIEGRHCESGSHKNSNATHTCWVLTDKPTDHPMAPRVSGASGRMMAARGLGRLGVLRLEPDRRSRAPTPGADVAEGKFYVI